MIPSLTAKLKIAFLAVAVGTLLESQSFSYAPSVDNPLYFTDKVSHQLNFVSWSLVRDGECNAKACTIRGKITDDEMNEVKQRNPNLEHIDLQLGDSLMSERLTQIFTYFPSIKTVFITGNSQTTLENNALSVIFESLRELKTLQISAVNLSSIDMVTIAENMHRLHGLSFLECRGLNRTFNQFNTLSALINERETQNLKHLCVSACPMNLEKSLPVILSTLPNIKILHVQDNLGERILTDQLIEALHSLQINEIHLPNPNIEYDDIMEKLKDLESLKVIGILEPVFPSGLASLASDAKKRYGIDLKFYQRPVF